MRHVLHLSLLSVSLLLSPVFLGNALAHETPPDADASFLRARAIALLRNEGVDPAPFLAAQVQLDLLGVEPMPLGDALDRLERLVPVAHAGGPAGTPAVTAGDFIHVMMQIGSDPQGYHVSASQVVPSTPPLFTTEDDFFDVGGPLLTIQGDWSSNGGGWHTVGSMIGSNVDTSEEGPFVPVLTTGQVHDDGIDFRGHALVYEDRVCMFGFCILVGSLIATGVAVWDATPVETPVVP